MCKHAIVSDHRESFFWPPGSVCSVPRCMRDISSYYPKFPVSWDSGEGGGAGLRGNAPGPEVSRPFTVLHWAPPWPFPRTRKTLRFLCVSLCSSACLLVHSDKASDFQTTRSWLHSFSGRCPWKPQGEPPPRVRLVLIYFWASLPKRPQRLLRTPWLFDCGGVGPNPEPV